MRGLEVSKSRLEPRLFAGYDIVLRRGLVVGAETEIGPSGGTRVARRSGIAAGATRSEQSYAISARIGAPINEKTLVYLRAGYAAERLHATYLGPTIRIFPPPQTESTFWAGGSTTGIGIERVLSSHVALQAEYQQRFLAHGYRGQALTIGAAWLF